MRAKSGHKLRGPKPLATTLALRLASPLVRTNKIIGGPTILPSSSPLEIVATSPSLHLQ